MSKQRRKCYTAEEVLEQLFKDDYSSSSDSSNSDNESDSGTDFFETDIIPPTPQKYRNRSKLNFLHTTRNNQITVDNISNTCSTTHPQHDQAIHYNLGSSILCQSPSPVTNNHSQIEQIQHIRSGTTSTPLSADASVDHDNTSSTSITEPVYTFDLDEEIPPISHSPTGMTVDSTPRTPISSPAISPCSSPSLLANDTFTSSEPPIPETPINSDSESDMDNVSDGYEVEPTSTPTLQQQTNYYEEDHTCTPISNYTRDTILQEDEDNGWSAPFPDQIPDQGPFTETAGLNVNMPSKQPEDFFNLLFDSSMFETIADQTNSYARDRITRIHQGRDPIQQLTHENNRRHNRMYNYKDVNASDIRIFMGHVLLMSLVKKASVHSYWSKSTPTRTPFFGKYISRNKFQSILWHLHMNDTSDNPPVGCENHDPLARLRNVISMAQRNFRHIITPSSDVAIDESTCVFRGKVKFLVYNKSKPNKFHIKLFMVSEKTTGYIIGFSVYTGKESNELVRANATLDPDCTTTTKTVMGLLHNCRLLDAHRRVWFDNWFNSTELLLELLSRSTLACGTCRSNRSGLPRSVTSKNVRLKRFETVYRRKGNLLCLKWMDKRPVTMLSSFHHAVEVVSKVRYNGEVVVKPLMIHQYNLNMNSVDQSDHLLSSYVALRGNKWYRKLFLHLFNLFVCNSYILNRQYGDKKMSHSQYKEYLAQYLITTSLQTATCVPGRPQTPSIVTEDRLSGNHFPQKFDHVSTCKRKVPTRRCKVCNFSTQKLVHFGYPGISLPTKYTSYTCNKCENMPLCIEPCFKLFHTESNYRKSALEYRISKDL